MREIVCYCLIILSLNGCLATKPQKSQEALENIMFSDTGTFDENLVDSMSANVNSIMVTSLGQLSVNQIPERLSKWFGAVADKEGRIEVEPNTVGAKSVGWIAGLLPIAYDFLKTELTYGMAGNYNVKVFCEPENGVIKQIMFIKKAE